MQTFRLRERWSLPHFATFAAKPQNVPRRDKPRTRVHHNLLPGRRIRGAMHLYSLGLTNPPPAAWFQCYRTAALFESSAPTIIKRRILNPALLRNANIPWAGAVVAPAFRGVRRKTAECFAARHGRAHDFVVTSCPCQYRRHAKRRAFCIVYLRPKVLFLGVCNTKSAPSGVAFAPAAKVAICRVLRLQISPARKVAVWRVLRLQSARIAPLDFSKTCFIWSKRFFARNRKRPRNFVIAGLCYFIQ